MDFLKPFRKEQRGHDRKVEKPAEQLPPDVAAAAKEGDLFVNSLAPGALSNVPDKIGGTGNTESLPHRPDTIQKHIKDLIDPPNPIDGVFRK